MESERSSSATKRFDDHTMKNDKAQKDESF
jgi:hypothetical protein